MAYDISGLSILLIDDDMLMKRLIKDVLFGFGVRNIHHAANGHEALHTLQASGWEIDIVIADLLMEPMDGLEFTRLVRRGDCGIDPFQPIIMLTGHSETDHVAAARDAGVTEFLAKPVTARAVYDRIVAIIERPRPFVRARGFIGPDRRRRKGAGYDGRERRAQADMIDL
ncbi:response regulator [Marivibrio halodurans]|uniref:Response regulator n=1 Tax=Marivibrio halodurans TaxID=2039722 RepID=A0A8J7RW59_9PROT|nr:response regulator [Marivibrio halodurans]MBP5855490.1 response regulator [Marivibrio halodurans]